MRSGTAFVSSTPILGFLRVRVPVCLTYFETLALSQLILSQSQQRVAERHRRQYARVENSDVDIYTNSQLRTVGEINQLPVKTVGQTPVRVADIGNAEDGQQIQTNLVRVDEQRSVYVPVMKQGGDTNTIAVVDGRSEE